MEFYDQRLLYELKQRIREVRTAANKSDRSIYDTIDQLETDLGRAILKLHAIAAVLEEKGLVTNDELAAKESELDAADGKIDGVLHPSYFRTDAENNRQLSPHAFLNKLEKMDFPTPRDFLGTLAKDENQSD